MEVREGIFQILSLLGCHLVVTMSSRGAAGNSFGRLPRDPVPFLIIVITNSHVIKTRPLFRPSASHFLLRG
mgnify:CR=1 FL=1